MMRIALYHNLPSGGAKRSVFEWTRRLARLHTVDVYSLSTADHEYCDLRPFVSQHRVYDFEPRRLFRSPFGRLNQASRWLDLATLDRLGHEIAMAINRGGYDVLFAHPCQFTSIPACLQFVTVPCVYYLHEPIGQDARQTVRRPYMPGGAWREALDRCDPFIHLYRARLRSIQQQNVSATTKLLANSDFTNARNAAVFGRQAELCQIGVDTHDFRPLETRLRKDFVLSVGEMSPRKGFDFVVDSLGKIPAGERPFLKLACNSVQSDELNYITQRALAQSVGLEVLTGLGSEQLRMLYSQARLCVYAPREEPFGLVPLEAMACGTAVIGVREGGVQESVVHGRTGLLVDRDVETFAAVIRSMLANPELSEEYGRNGREYVVGNWSWERSVAALTRHLEECRYKRSEVNHGVVN
jgi:glycosyltransferase involved in cell wall biosynthesis